MCTIFVQLVFPRKKRALKHALFEKNTLPYKNSGFRAKNTKKTLVVLKMHFSWHTNLQLVNQVFKVAQQNPFKNPIFIVLFETTNFLMAFWKEGNFFRGKMMNNK